MEIVKKLARRILRKELSQYTKNLDDLNEGFCEQSKLISEYTQKFTAQEKRIKYLEDKVFGKIKILLPQKVVECIVQMLPDSNEVGSGRITASDLKMRTMCITEELGGVKYCHKLEFIKVLGEGSIEGLTIHISNYNISVHIPLRREKVNYEVFGTSSSIDTYFWDFYGAGIRMISQDAWKISTEFIRAQRNVLSNLRKEGLL